MWRLRAEDLILPLVLLAGTKVIFTAHSHTVPGCLDLPLVFFNEPVQYCNFELFHLS